MGVQWNLGLDGGDVAGASRWQLVGVDEDALVSIARVEGEHAVDGVHVNHETGEMKFSRRSTNFQQ